MKFLAYNLFLITILFSCNKNSDDIGISEKFTKNEIRQVKELTKNLSEGEKLHFHNKFNKLSTISLNQSNPNIIKGIDEYQELIGFFQGKGEYSWGLLFEQFIYIDNGDRPLSSLLLSDLALPKYQAIFSDTFDDEMFIKKLLKLKEFGGDK